MKCRKYTAWLMVMVLLTFYSSEGIHASEGIYAEEVQTPAADLNGTTGDIEENVEADESEPIRYRTIHIQSAEDLVELSGQCVLDSWSLDACVILDKDIDLAGSGFTSIPCFSGVFDGKGHSIKGVNIASSGSHAGLFRYLTKEAIVRDLIVDGRIIPGINSTYIGGIAGRNDGMISGCCVAGNLTAQENTGGIAGENTQTGVISDCVFTGTIVGAHAVGGIAGHNSGKILSCRNTGEVNTQAEVPIEKKPVSLSGDLAATLENYDISSISNEDFVSVMDIGGIAGYSDGLIDNCTNSGTVGYPHTGYNVGGIAGRTAGYISCCANEGEILGRKDTGGIAGQIEPMTIWDYSSQQLDTLLEQLKTLDSLLTTMVQDASLGIGTTRDHITEAEKQTSETVRQMKLLLGETQEELLKEAGNIKDLAETLASAVREEDAQGIASCLSQLYQLLKDTDFASQGLTLRVTGNMNADTSSSLTAGSSGMSAILAELMTRISQASSGTRTLRQATGGTVDNSIGTGFATDGGYSVNAAGQDPDGLIKDPDAAATESAGTGDAGPDSAEPGENGAADEDLNLEDLMGSPEDPSSWEDEIIEEDLFEEDADGAVSPDEIFLEESGMQAAPEAGEKDFASQAEDADGEDQTVVFEMPRADAEPEAMELNSGSIEAAADTYGSSEAAADAAGGNEAAADAAGSNEAAADAAGSNEAAADTVGGNEADVSILGSAEAPNAGELAAASTGTVDMNLNGQTTSGLDGQVKVSAGAEDFPNVNQIISLMEQILGHSSTLLDAQTLKLAKEILDELTFDAPDAEPFYTSFEGMLLALRPLDNDIADTAANFSSDFTAVMNQVDAIYDTLFGYIENFTLPEIGTEEEVIAADPWQSNQGAVSECVNLAGISADTNVGGIVGSVEHEDMIDAEDIVNVSKYLLKDARKMIFASVRSCENKGAVTAKKTAAGGIAGSLQFGVIAGCISSGKIEVAEGDYCGGIAGTSEGQILLCQSANLLSGQSYVGGTAGKAAGIKNCISSSQVIGAGEYIGAVAGESTGDLEQNYYLDRGLGGVDSVSFHGSTDPFSEEEIPALTAQLQTQTSHLAASAQADLPDAAAKTSQEAAAVQADQTNLAQGEIVMQGAFDIKPTVTFKVGDEIIAQEQVDFGGSLDALPEVPMDGDNFWVWDDFDQDAIFSDITVTGSYHHPAQTLSAEGNPPKFLAEGTFYDGQELQITAYDGKIEGLDGSDEAPTETYTICVRNYEGPLTARMKAEDGGKLQKVQDGKAASEISYRRDGSYLVFEIENGETIAYEHPQDRLHIVKHSHTAAYAAIGAAAAILLILLLILKKRRLKK